MATAKKLPSGNWRVLAYIETVNGERKYKSFTASSKNQAELNATLYKVRRKRAGTSLTVGEAIDRYIDSKSPVLSPNTVKEYKKTRLCSLQRLMPVKLDQLTDEQIQIAISEYSADHAPKTVRNAYALFLSSVKLFKPDFRPVVTMPQRTAVEVTIPTDEAVQTLIKAAKGDLKTAIMFAATLGLRRSEICGLNWSDVNGHTIRISKAVVMNENLKWVTKVTKTTLSTRTLEMPLVLSEYLKPLKGQGKLMKVNPDTVTRDFVRLCKRLNMDIHFHSLRHFYASTLLEMGVPDLYAMRRLGHSTTGMLKTVYQHIKDKRQQEIDKQIDDKLSGLFGQA